MKKILVLFLFIIIIRCANPRTFDIVLYDNVKYQETNVQDILVVTSRLDIKDKYFEIGLIKATKEINFDYIKKSAAENGANIIIEEGNTNFTLARYKIQNNEGPNETNYIKT